VGNEHVFDIFGSGRSFVALNSHRKRYARFFKTDVVCGTVPYRLDLINSAHLHPNAGTHMILKPLSHIKCGQCKLIRKIVYSYRSDSDKRRQSQSHLLYALGMHNSMHTSPRISHSHSKSKPSEANLAYAHYLDSNVDLNRKSKEWQNYT
jgi:hypothetical protein